MCYLGGYQAWAPKSVCYYAIIDETGEICGVNSCHDTGHLLVRSRGLWVDPSRRGHGLGQKLLDFAVDWTRTNKYIALWSYPKLSAWNTYRAVGFERQADWQVDPDTQQQNCYAIRFI
jgi:GNAT superfamily N-acetyltransferase